MSAHDCHIPEEFIELAIDRFIEQQRIDIERSLRRYRIKQLALWQGGLEPGSSASLINSSTLVQIQPLQPILEVSSSCPGSPGLIDPGHPLTSNSAPELSAVNRQPVGNPPAPSIFFMCAWCKHPFDSRGQKVAGPAWAQPKEWSHGMCNDCYMDETGQMPKRMEAIA